MTGKYFSEWSVRSQVRVWRLWGVPECHWYSLICCVLYSPRLGDPGNGDPGGRLGQEQNNHRWLEIRSALSLILSLDFVTQDHYYEFDKEWEMEYGKGMGVMYVVCTREKPHILMCRYIVWWLNASMLHVAFYQDQRSETKDGELTTSFSFMSRVPSVWGHSTIRISVRVRSCLDQFILISFSAAKKYYQRRGVAGTLFEEEASEEYSFFSNEEDDDFFSDEDDDDEFWDDWFY